MVLRYPRNILAAVTFIGIALNLFACSGPTCTGSQIEAGDTCCCTVDLPVNTANLVAQGGAKIWPFGAHGQSGHPEGHPGIDFVSSVSIDVVAAADGTVTKIEAAPASEYVSGSMAVYIQAKCGITHDYQPVTLASTITVGSVVARGQKLGVMSEMVAPYGPGRFSFHFDTRGSSAGSSKYTSFCPGLFVTAADLATLQALVDESSYSEKTARTTSITCSTGSTQNFTYLAESKVCNPHLESAQAAQLDACLLLGATRPVW